MDTNQTAKRIVDTATGQILKEPSAPTGRQVGGKARAASLTPDRRREIAQKAAAQRWGKGEK